LYIDIEVQERKRVIDVTHVRTAIGDSCCQALPGLHTFTGNDYTSAFHGIGKVKAFKILMEEERFAKCFQRLAMVLSSIHDFFLQLNLFFANCMALNARIQMKGDI
jgi:hypothetical protein